MLKLGYLDTFLRTSKKYISESSAHVLVSDLSKVLKAVGFEVVITEQQMCLGYEERKVTIDILPTTEGAVGKRGYVPFVCLLRVLVYVISGDFPPDHKDSYFRTWYAYGYLRRLVPKKAKEKDLTPKPQQ
jgi:hypothetical protein